MEDAIEVISWGLVLLVFLASVWYKRSADAVMRASKEYRAAGEKAFADGHKQLVDAMTARTGAVAERVASYEKANATLATLDRFQAELEYIRSADIVRLGFHKDEETGLDVSVGALYGKPADVDTLKIDMRVISCKEHGHHSLLKVTAIVLMDDEHVQDYFDKAGTPKETIAEHASAVLQARMRSQSAAAPEHGEELN